MISPLPIVAVVLMLVSGNARVNALAFVVAWFLSITAVTVIVSLAAVSASSDDGAPSSWQGWLKVLLGFGLIALAVKQWRGRPRDDAEPETPKWMAAVDTFTPVKAAGLAALLAVVNPKNLLLAVSGGAAIATAAAGSTGAAIGASLVFAVVASAGVAAPVIVYFGAGDRAAHILGNLKQWLTQHNGPIMAVLLLVIGAKLIGDGITIL